MCSAGQQRINASQQHFYVSSHFPAADTVRLLMLSSTTLTATRSARHGAAYLAVGCRVQAPARMCLPAAAAPAQLAGQHESASHIIIQTSCIPICRVRTVRMLTLPAIAVTGAWRHAAAHLAEGCRARAPAHVFQPAVARFILRWLEGYVQGSSIA
jgi:hypothetical protein